MSRQLYVIHRKDKVMTEAMQEFLDFCDVMSTCDDERICLSYPWKLQSMLARQSNRKKA